MRPSMASYLSGDHVEILRQKLSEGADPNEWIEGLPLIEYAAQRCFPKIVAYLLDIGIWSDNLLFRAAIGVRMAPNHVNPVINILEEGKLFPETYLKAIKGQLDYRIKLDTLDELGFTGIFYARIAGNNKALLKNRLVWSPSKKTKKPRVIAARLSELTRVHFSRRFKRGEQFFLFQEQLDFIEQIRILLSSLPEKNDLDWKNLFHNEMVAARTYEQVYMMGLYPSKGAKILESIRLCFRRALGFCENLPAETLSDIGELYDFFSSARVWIQGSYPEDSDARVWIQGSYPGDSDFPGHLGNGMIILYEWILGKYDPFKNQEDAQAAWNIIRSIEFISECYVIKKNKGEEKSAQWARRGIELVENPVFRKVVLEKGFSLWDHWLLAMYRLGRYYELFSFYLEKMKTQKDCIRLAWAPEQMDFFYVTERPRDIPMGFEQDEMNIFAAVATIFSLTWEEIDCWRVYDYIFNNIAVLLASELSSCIFLFCKALEMGIDKKYETHVNADWLQELHEKGDPGKVLQQINSVKCLPLKDQCSGMVMAFAQQKGVDSLLSQIARLKEENEQLRKEMSTKKRDRDDPKDVQAEKKIKEESLSAQAGNTSSPGFWSLSRPSSVTAQGYAQSKSI